jgi:hypothetical protein
VAALEGETLGAIGITIGVDGTAEGLAATGFCLMTTVGVKGKAEKGSGRPPMLPAVGSAPTGGISEGTGSAEGRTGNRLDVALNETGGFTVSCSPVPKLVLRPQAVINPATPTQLNIKSLLILICSLNHILRDSPEFAMRYQMINILKQIGLSSLKRKLNR